MFMARVFTVMLAQCVHVCPSFLPPKTTVCDVALRVCPLTSHTIYEMQHSSDSGSSSGFAVGGNDDDNRVGVGGGGVSSSWV